MIFAVFALICGYLLVPLFSHLTFFTMLYGWFKYAYTKTFVDFFNYLNNLRLNSISLQEREVLSLFWTNTIMKLSSHHHVCGIKLSAIFQAVDR